MKTTESTQGNFLMLDNNLLSTPISRITAQQKILISWILGWQKENKECFASNQAIANAIGMTKEGVKSLLKSCSYSFPTFFTCTPDTKENGVPFHTISIDVEELFKFIAEDQPVSKVKRRNKIEATQPTIIEKVTPTIVAVKEDLNHRINEVKDEMVRLQGPIILLEKDKGLVKTIETISDTLPEEIEVIFKFDDGEEMDSIAYYVDGVYYLKYEYISEQNKRIDEKAYQL